MGPFENTLPESLNAPDCDGYVEPVKLIDEPGWLRLERRSRVVIARFGGPHRTVSSCDVNGGLRDDVLAFYNHQLCEPAGHDGRAMRFIGSGALEQHRLLCEAHGLDAARTAGHGTAANMARIGIARRQFREVSVIAACTAGVDGNAGRAGDPAGLVEENGEFVAISDDARATAGTIVTMLFVDRELTPGALVRAVATATEAKTAVLTDLRVGSRYSRELATGTGTDQVSIASRSGTGVPLTGTGHHTVLGQMIGESVREAVASALVLQNDLTPDRRRGVTDQLARFGVTSALLEAEARRVLQPEEAELLVANLSGLDRDPLVVAAVAASAAVFDQVTVGILPRSLTGEYVLAYGGQIAAAASGGEAAAHEFASALHGLPLAPESLVPTALALGYARKWAD